MVSLQRLNSALSAQKQSQTIQKGIERGFLPGGRVVKIFLPMQEIQETRV